MVGRGCARDGKTEWRDMPFDLAGSAAEHRAQSSAWADGRN
jgi:hypothetical protein